jgi:hypothetical protein
VREPLIGELRWLFETRRQRPGTDRTRLDRAAHAFAGPRFRALYRTWLERGDYVLDATMSPALADAIARRMGRMECHALPHGYLRLSPLAGTS